jgi:hypothetical protein
VKIGVILANKKIGGFQSWIPDAASEQKVVKKDSKF